MEINVGKVKKANGWEYQEQKMFLTGADMEYVRDISIIDAVINVLDRSSEEPVFNNFKLTLTDHIYKFLYKHCENLFKSDDLQYAVYTDEQRAVKDVTQEFLMGKNTNIVEMAKEHTREFFYNMKDNSVDNCDLITMYISTDQGAMIGILKMDYANNFMHKVSVVDDKHYVDIVQQALSLPGTVRKIKKAAFMKPARDGQIVDAMIVNRSGREVDNNYFIDKFLGCKLIKNKRDETRRFMIAVEEFIKRNIENVGDAIDIRNEIKNKLKFEDSIDLAELAQEIFEDEEKIDLFNEFMGNQSLDRIDVDKNFVDKKLKKVRLNVDRELDMYLSAEYYNDFNKFKVVRNGDGTVDIVLKGIKNYIEK